MALLPYSASNGNTSDQARFGVLRSMNIGGSPVWISGMSKELVDGSPGAPSLKLDRPNSWRFRWAIRSTGAHTIQINAKQAVNQNPRPSMIVRANPSIGIYNDVSASAPTGTGWVLLGPISVTTSAVGATYVDISNNYSGSTSSSCYFDHIVST